MRCRYFILIFALFCFTKVSAQQVLTIKGVISKNLSTERVPQALITNLRTRDIMMSDDLGWFSIKAAIGDTLLFKKTGFADQKVAITSANDIPVYMQPVITLAEVRVQGQTTKQELADVMNQYRTQGTFYDGKPPILSFLSSPLTGIYELFGKTPNEAKRFVKYSKEELEYAEVRRRYTITLVKRVTKTSDSTAKKFMEYYTPSYEDLKEWNDYELIKRIEKAYDYYDKNKDEEDLQHINAPLLVTPKTKENP